MLDMPQFSKELSNWTTLATVAFEIGFHLKPLKIVFKPSNYTLHND
jgi:hypothetical protein